MGSEGGREAHLLQAKNDKQEECAAQKINGQTRMLLPLRGVPVSKLDTTLDASSEQAKEVVHSAKRLSPRHDTLSMKPRELVETVPSTSLSLPATLSPFFGGWAADTFDSPSYGAVSEISVLGSRKPPLLLFSLLISSSLPDPLLPRLHSKRDIGLLGRLLPDSARILQL